MLLPILMITHTYILLSGEVGLIFGGVGRGVLWSDLFFGLHVDGPDHSETLGKVPDINRIIKII